MQSSKVGTLKRGWPTLDKAKGSKGMPIMLRSAKSFSFRSYVAVMDGGYHVPRNAVHLAAAKRLG